jgi:transcriptional regulator PpsR
MPSAIHSAQPDVTLMLDPDGVIQHVTVANAMSAELVDGWCDKPWADTIEEAGSRKIQTMLAEARQNGVSAFREVNQRFPSGLEVPMEYTTVRLSGRAGLLAIGRNMRAVAELQSGLVAAQQAIEQEYWKVRDAETRYRLLFDASHEPVLALRADTLAILEANPAAIRGLSVTRGRSLLHEIAETDHAAFHAMLDRVRRVGGAPGTLLHIGAKQEGWMVRASLMPAEPPRYLLQLAPAEPTPLLSNDLVQTALDNFVDRFPDAVVVMDKDGFIRRANRAFLALAEVGAEGAVLGISLSRFLIRLGADLSGLLSLLHRYGSVRLFRATIKGELGGEAEVEISAAGNAPSRNGHTALLLRDAGRRLSNAAPADGLRDALAEIIAQSGRTPLRNLARDTVELVERHYIAAALHMTKGNRTAAADMLGLSRQGFYKKLAQYGLEGYSRSKEAAAA